MDATLLPATAAGKLAALAERFERLVGEGEARQAAMMARVRAYEAALREAVLELEATRDAFRSRRLRDLRLQIARVLGEGAHEA